MFQRLCTFTLILLLVIANAKAKNEYVDDSDDLYDYIVIGAGTAGSIVARKLVDGGYTVLLVEEGPHSNHPGIYDATNWWNFWMTQRQPTMGRYYTSVPQIGLNNRTLNVARGKVTGGCHAVNAMVFVRGYNEDYDRWEALGNPGWGWSLMRSSLHDYVSYFPDLYIADNSRPLMNPLLQTLRNSGYSYNTDPVFGDRQSGITNRRFTLKYQGINNTTSQRQTTFTQYINSKISSLHSLDLLVYHKVIKLNFDSRKRISGVVLLDIGSNRTLEIKPHREVIISAGTYDSPRILLLSGIGPAADLGALGIPLVVSLPGVGKNLRDHNWLGLSGPLLKDQSIEIGARIAPHDGFLVFGPDYNHTGNTPLKWALNIDIEGTAPNKRVTCAVEPFQPRSVGTVKLRSTNPFDDPLIDPAYFTDQAGYDYKTFIEGVRECRRIYSRPPLVDMLQGPETESTPGWTVKTDDDIGGYIRRTATDDFHPVGTCKMGPSTDPLAVVDSRLRLKGVTGVRVVDASIMPYITSGNTNTPTALIATKAAQFILGDALQYD